MVTYIDIREMQAADYLMPTTNAPGLNGGDRRAHAMRHNP
jgi:hypothetical protein